MRRLHALTLLGWHFALHWLKKLTFTYRRGGIARFRQNFDHEGLVPLTAEERDLLPTWHACVGCGFCEAVCPDLAAVPAGRHVAPMFLAQSAMRDLSQARLALPSADLLARCEDCTDCADICPSDIPLQSLAQFLVRIGEEAGQR